MTKAPLRPKLTLSDILGPQHLFFPRAHPQFSDWLPDDPLVLDALTGLLTITGDMPIVCSKGCDTPAGLDLLALAGLEVAPDRILFRAGEELDALTLATARSDARIVFQHAFPSAAPAQLRSWIDPALFPYLNNKAKLGELVLPQNVSPRRIVDRAEYFAIGDQPLPAVLKVVTEQSTGAGLGVAICRSSDDLAQAAGLFAKCDEIVVEAVLGIVRNPCLNFAVMSQGEVRYLGFADQEVTPEGQHYGNWIDLGSSQSEMAIEAATEPVRRAAALGYRGLAGVDLALTDRGDTYVLDLNFRSNGSAPAILLAPAIGERSGAKVIHYRTVRMTEGAEKLARTLAPYVASDRVVPLNLFDADAAGYPGGPARAQLLFLAESREGALATGAELAALGVV